MRISEIRKLIHEEFDTCVDEQELTQKYAILYSYLEDTLKVRLEQIKKSREIKTQINNIQRFKL